MPLRKRLETELCSVWREHALPYKDLQHEAEELVGNDDDESEAIFVNHATCAMERASAFYDDKVKELQGVFEEVTLSIVGVHDVHKDRQKCTTLAKPQTSPSTSTEHIWDMKEAPAAEGADDEAEESRRVMQKCFEIWTQDARYKPRRTSLASFCNDSFLLTLEESALKDALREFLQMLVYLDRIRNFALLNSVVALKLAQCHCGTKTEKLLTEALHALPMFKMEVPNDLVPEIEALARTLHEKLWPGADELPSSWSLHVCAFCSHTAANPVLLPVGRTCCWKCAAVSASNAIVYCPLTDKPMSVKDIHLERTLVTFLRRFFPAALKDAPPQLVSDNAPAEAKPKVAMSMVGMLSALKSPKITKQEGKGKVAVSRRQLRTMDLMRPPSFEFDKLNQEVSCMLKELATPDSPGQGKGRCIDSPMLLPLRRRNQRAVSEPGEPPNLQDMFLTAPSLVDHPVVERKLECNLRGFPVVIPAW